MLTAVHVPARLDEVVDLLKAGGTVLGGGTTLMPRLNDYASPDTVLVSLRNVGLGEVTVEGDVITLGAAVTLARLERDPQLSLLRPVVRTIASPVVRSLATVAGNLFAPQPHGDLAVALTALGAEVEMIDDSGRRVVPIETMLADEGGSSTLVTAIRFRAPADGDFRFRKAARRRLNSASIVTIAAVVELDGNAVSNASIALGGVGPRVIRARAIEAALVGSALDVDTVTRAAEAGMGEISPQDDAYASAWYRRRVFPVHLRRALLGDDSTKEN